MTKLNRRDAFRLAGAGTALAAIGGLAACGEANNHNEPAPLAPGNGQVGDITFRTTEPVNFRIIADGLRFPEGPVAMDDGSVIVTEIEAGRLTRIQPDGTKTTVAETGGGPNGAAIGPDGKIWVANNGGFEWHENAEGQLIPGNQAADYAGGKIQKVDLDTGAVENVYAFVDGRPLKGPNDLVFDGKDGFWFTDLGKDRPQEIDRGGLHYARVDGSMIKQVVFPMITSNGCGLSPDGDVVYVAESLSGRLWGYDITGEGEIAPPKGFFPGRMIGAPGGETFFDSMAVEADGSICIATPLRTGITRITADGKLIEHMPLDDIFTTNLCFGGDDMQTCYVTLSSKGQLAAIDWPRPGLKLNYSA